MKQWILIAAGGLLLFSCKKNDNNGVTPATADSFVFGVSGGLCGECYHYFKMEQGKIYMDSTLTNAGRVFHTVPMPSAKYNLAVSLMNNFPGYLLQHPNTNYSCNDCADQRVFFLQTKKGSTATKWNIDEIESVQPAPVKPYIRQMDTVISQLL